MCVSWAQALAASPGLGWSVGVQAGHDDQILADPEHLGVLRSVSGYGWTGKTLVHLTWPGLTGRDDPLEIRGGGAFTRYRNDILEGDTDLDAQISYRRLLSSRWSGEAYVSGSRFRREGVPFFDLDLIEADLRANCSLRSRSFVSIGARAGFPFFPGRPLAGDSTRTEADRQARFTAGFHTIVMGNLAAGVEGGVRLTSSNDPLIENSGPVVIARGSLRVSDHATATIETAFTQRSYSEYPVLVQTADSLARTGDWRRDRTWQLLIEMEGKVAAGCEAYAGGAWVRQTSNVAALAYDQSRFYVGLRFTPIRSERREHRRLSRGVGWGDPASRTPLAPIETPSGVLFRFNAPGARTVSLVGDFNGWDPRTDLLAGPDGTGGWRITRSIPPGLWRYAFVVDGIWTKPPDAVRYEEDGFGGENGLVLVTGNLAPAAGGGEP